MYHDMNKYLIKTYIASKKDAHIKNKGVRVYKTLAISAITNKNYCVDNWGSLFSFIADKYPEDLI